MAIGGFLLRENPTHDPLVNADSLRTVADNGGCCFGEGLGNGEAGAVGEVAEECRGVESMEGGESEC